MSRPQAASESQRGDLDAARAEGMDVTHWSAKQDLARRGLAWTRENFIAYNWPAEGDLPDPEDWTESELPDDLQDWNAPPPQ